MNIRVILSITIIALGSIAAVLPQKQNDSIQLNERQLLQEMLLESNYISVDELAHRLIDGDPSIRLIDVRPAAEFKDPLPRAINVPIDSIFSDNYAYLFDQDAMQNIIYSDGDQRATQVWMITKQLGYANNYLLKGGMEAWKEDILDPTYPPTTASAAEFALYDRRVAARAFFTGEKALPKVDFTPIAPIKSRKKKRVQGGCS